MLERADDKLPDKMTFFMIVLIFIEKKHLKSERQKKIKDFIELFSGILDSSSTSVPHKVLLLLIAKPTDFGPVGQN